jgi:cell division protein FtsQ
MVDACGRAVRRSLRAMVVALALAALGGAGWAGHRWLTSSPRFAITQITIDGAHRIDPDELRAQLPVRIGDNAFADLTAIARAVRDNPWVATASVRRMLPHTIAIEIHEHVPAAVVELGDSYLCDATGRLFKRADALDERREAMRDGAGAAGGAGSKAPRGDNTAGLPLITGLDRASYAADPEAGAITIRDAIAAATAWHTSTRPAIHEVHVDPHGALTLQVGEPAIAIQLGALGHELPARLRTFDAAWAELSDAERTRARAIHLGVRQGHVTVAFARN